MKAEDRLKKLYGKHQDTWQSTSYVSKDEYSRVHVSARDIELIADLVVERLSKKEER